MTKVSPFHNKRAIVTSLLSTTYCVWKVCAFSQVAVRYGVTQAMLSSTAQNNTSKIRRRRSRAVHHHPENHDIQDDTASIVPTILNRKQPNRRVNRPGHNSYLKVVLDDDTMDRLYAIAIDIQRRLKDKEYLSEGPRPDSRSRALVNDASDDAGTWTTIHKNRARRSTDVRSTTQPNRMVTFTPRSLESLHMTLFFGGETLCNIPGEELVCWHSQISDRLAQSAFCLANMEDNIKGTTSDGATVAESLNELSHFSFHVTGLVAFPPQRNNLVVAILEAGREWHDLHNDLRSVAQDDNLSKGLSEITKYSKDRWVAHVTLGNLYGGTKQQYKELNPLFEEIFHNSFPGADSIDATTTTTSGIEVTDPTCRHPWRVFAKSISMGGPVPQQVVLDWEFKNMRWANQETNSKSG